MPNLSVGDREEDGKAQSEQNQEVAESAMLDGLRAVDHSLRLVGMHRDTRRSMSLLVDLEVRALRVASLCGRKVGSD